MLGDMIEIYIIFDMIIPFTFFVTFLIRVLLLSHLFHTLTEIYIVVQNPQKNFKKLKSIQNLIARKLQ